MVQRIAQTARAGARCFRNAVFDLRYGGFAGGYRRNPNAGSNGAGNTDYAVMAQIFDGRICKSDVLVDVGCGKGRVINWWLHCGLQNTIIGIEQLEDVAAKLRHRLRRWKNVTIRSGDALSNLPENGTVFYLFNPFEADVMERFKDTLVRVVGNRSITVIYFACVHVGVFKNDPRWSVREVTVHPPNVGFFEDRHRRLAIIRLRQLEPDHETASGEMVISPEGVR